MTPIRWSVLAASTAAAGLAVLSATHSSMAWRLINPLALSLSDLARSARALLPL